MKIEIRNAKLDDVVTLHHFMIQMALETEGLFLDKDALHFGISSALNDENKAIYLIAEIDNNVVGSLMITKEWSDWRGSWIFWIQSVYTLPQYRKMGVYKALYNHVLNWAKKDSNCGGIRLYVDKSNSVAKQVYTKLEMNGNHYQLFEWMK